MTKTNKSTLLDQGTTVHTIPKGIQDGRWTALWTGAPVGGTGSTRRRTNPAEYTAIAGFPNTTLRRHHSGASGTLKGNTTFGAGVPRQRPLLRLFEKRRGRYRHQGADSRVNHRTPFTPNRIGGDTLGWSTNDSSKREELRPRGSKSNSSSAISLFDPDAPRGRPNGVGFPGLYGQELRPAILPPSRPQRAKTSGSFPIVFPYVFDITRDRCAAKAAHRARPRPQTGVTVDSSTDYARHLKRRKDS